MITGPQIGAARGFLAWDRRDLAKKAVVTIYTVERIETGADISGTAMAKGLVPLKLRWRLRVLISPTTRASWVYGFTRRNVASKSRLFSASAPPNNPDAQ